MRAATPNLPCIARISELHLSSLSFTGCLKLQSEPERLRGELEAFLTGLDVPYSYSTTTKFANFRNRTLE